MITTPEFTDPATGQRHRNDHICNQQCRDLKAAARKAHTMTDYDHYYGNTTPFDEEVEAFKDHLRKAVKEETQKELDTLRTENKDMAGKLANLEALERAAVEVRRGYEFKLRNVEATARQTVQKEGLHKLLELLREPRYRVTVVFDEQPKCGRCDEGRRLRYTTPRGREAYDMCECSATTRRWTVEEMLVHEVAKRNGKLLAWYHPGSRYFDDDTISSPNVLKSADGVALEEMVKNPRDYGFGTEDAAQLLADALNAADA